MKTSLIALATVLAVSATALPALASTNSIFGSGDTQFTKDSIVQELRHKGIDAKSVEEWGHYVRAFVTLEDGTQVMQFFDPDTLQPVDL